MWLARDLELGEPVALKVFREGVSATQRERLRQEVRLGRSLNHPGLVRIFELIETRERPAVAMEWITGGSLAERAAKGPLAVAEVVAYAEQALEALAYLHERSIVHRDVKPSNLLVDAGGRVRLADLGLVRLLVNGSSLTRTAATVGTTGFMSPEQIRGQPLTPASDLYSLGVTLFVLLTGAPPFSGASEFEVADRHLRATAPDPRRLRSDCPRWLGRFVVRLLEKRPGDRFPDAAAALRAFHGRHTAASPRRVRRIALVVAGAAAALALAAIAPRTWRGEAARTTVVGKTVIVSDAEGRELWRKRFDGMPFAAAVITGRGERWVAVALDEHAETMRRGRPRVVILAEDGNEVASTKNIVERLGPALQQTPEGRFHAFRAEDLDGDGEEELAWLVTHPIEYPGGMGVWAPGSGLQPTPVLTNSGHLNEIGAADLDGDGRKELIATGINNPMGFQLVVSIVEVRRNGKLPTLQTWYSPDRTGFWCRANYVLPSPPGMAYVPLGPYDGVETILSAGPDGIVLQAEEKRIELDAAGNPRGSPLFGSGIEARERFWVDLADTSTRIRDGDADASAAAQRFLVMHARVLQEQGSRIAASLLLARSQAESGDHRAAVRLLRRAVAADPGVTDLWLRLGEQEFLAGDRRTALATLAKAAEPRPGGRPRAQAMFVQGIGAALEGDARYRRISLDALQRSSAGPTSGMVAELQALQSFAAGDMTAPALGQSSPANDLPTVAVARMWAKLQAGAAPGAAEEAAEAARTEPQLRDSATLLVAEIHRRRGELDRALATAQEALRSLRLAGRTSLEATFWYAVAEHEVGALLTDTGREAEAEPYFRRAASMAPGCWFGRRTAVGLRPARAEHTSLR